MWKIEREGGNKNTKVMSFDKKVSDGIISGILMNMISATLTEVSEESE